MSVSSIRGQEPKTVSYCDDHPPQYDTCQPSGDMLTSVLEYERTDRNIRFRLNDIGAEMLNKIQKIDEWEMPDSPDYIFAAEFYQEIGQLATEMGQSLTELANITKECAVKHPDLCIVMARLSENEFNRIYDSSKRDLNQRMQHGLAQDHTNSEPDQRPPSDDTVNPSKMNDDGAAPAAAKPRVSFWANLQKVLTRLFGSNRKVDFGSLA